MGTTASRRLRRSSSLPQFPHIKTLLQVSPRQKPGRKRPPRRPHERTVAHKTHMIHPRKSTCRMASVMSGRTGVRVEICAPRHVTWERCRLLDEEYRHPLSATNIRRELGGTQSSCRRKLMMAMRVLCMTRVSHRLLLSQKRTD